MDLIAPRISVLELEDGLDDLPRGVCANYPRAEALREGRLDGWLERDGSFVAVRAAHDGQVWRGFGGSRFFATFAAFISRALAVRDLLCTFQRGPLCSTLSE